MDLKTNNRSIPMCEFFKNVEGEGIHAGKTTIYIRVAKCNKKCPYFNNPNKEISSTGYSKIEFDPSTYIKIQDLPVINMGCDTQYAVNPEFAHMWEEYTADQMVDKLFEFLPDQSWTIPKTNQDVILSLTGGEPMLYMDFFVNELLQHPRMQDCKHVLIETNASVPLRQKDADTLYEWAERNGSTVTWSNSPKLSNSGETWKSSIRPNVLLSQRSHSFIEKYPHRFHQYVKFVCDGEQTTMDEIDKAMQEYYAAGVPNNIEIGLMPEAATAEQQLEIMQKVANICIQQGYRFVIRLQNILWGNAVGT